MQLKTRLIILASCILVFLVVVPYLVFYALGYRIDVRHFEITKTGGIYVKAEPTGANIIIDSTVTNKTGIFSTSVFVQNLLPGPHSVAIKKEGYYEYQKTLEVKEKEVTKLENVTLFRQQNSFVRLAQNADYVSFAPNNTSILVATYTQGSIDIALLSTVTPTKKTTYITASTPIISQIIWTSDSSRALIKASTAFFLLDVASPELIATSLPALTKSTSPQFNPANNQEIFFIKDKNLYSTESATPIAKDVIAYTFSSSGNILWLSGGGDLIDFNISLGNTGATAGAITIKKNTSYRMFESLGRTFIQEGNLLAILNTTTKSFETIIEGAPNIKESGDGKKMLFYGPRGVFISIIGENNILSLPSLILPGNAMDAYWLNSDYIITNLNGRISICEIDTRGNINTIKFPETISFTDAAITTGNSVTTAITAPSIFFNSQSLSVYVVSNRSIFSSEKLLP